MTVPSQTFLIHGKQLQGAGKGREPMGTGQLAAAVLLLLGRVLAPRGHQQCHVLPYRE